ncbi:MAG: BamA/TamA family outer membrane protein, partial [Phycisphaerae bacterium]|nr:BamA/TamA family outer membrane protein [Phycisphaerae bacterium]
TKYGSIGYIEAKVSPTWVFASEPGLVVLTLAITEGKPFDVGWIEVKGNFQTQEKVVRRELRFYPEERWDITQVRAAEKRLKDTGLFTEATIEPVVPETHADQVRDVLVNVKESDRTNSFIIGAGVSSDNGLVGNIMLQNNNFDLFDRPRSWSDFIRGKAFRGAGQTLRLQFEPGTQFTRARIDFREPYFMNMPVGLNTSAYLFDRRRDGYKERRYGGTVSFDHKFEKGSLRGWTSDIALRTELVQVLDRKSFAAKSIRDVAGDNFLGTIKLTMMHDTTDSRFDPSRGHLFSVAYEQAAGGFFFGKITSRFVQHFTLATDEQDRKSVLSLRAEAGQILGDAPVFERFYAGGIGSMRGFNFRGIGPREGLRHNRVGGDFTFLTGAEYSFPLYAKVVRGVCFSDMGTVEQSFGINSWRMAVGAGVRLNLDIFGPVPMEFDLAYPVMKDREDNISYFSFFVGLPFF